jgi:hypothetical protein
MKRKQENKNKDKEDYLENPVPLALASRYRFSPAGGLAMEE